MNNDQAQKKAESYSVSKYGSYNDTAINGFIAGFNEQQTELDEVKRDFERLKEEVMFNQKYLDMPDSYLEEIRTAAKVSYNRHNSRAGGCMVTAADSWESHLTWAAQAYERKNQQLTIERLKKQYEMLLGQTEAFFNHCVEEDYAVWNYMDPGVLDGHKRFLKELDK